MASNNWLMPCEILPAGILVSIADYTRPELIVPQLRERDPAGIIEELSQRLRANGIVGDVLSFYQAVVNHEFLSSSALPSGIATPHARSAQVSRLMLAVGRAREPVVWGIKESWSIEFIFLLAVPSTEALNHLALLSGIAGLGRQPEMLARLRAAADARGVFDLLHKINVRPG
jgi:mannitol/fructose-specific phosphotransferase system IIA component (Ntr-type)